MIPGGHAAQYPPGNSFPASLDAVGFVARGRGDYRLADASPNRRAGPDGKDLGADFAPLARTVKALSR